MSISISSAVALLNPNTLSAKRVPIREAIIEAAPDMQSTHSTSKVVRAVTINAPPSQLATSNQ